MKKLILVFLVILSAATAKAQVWLGGELGYSYSDDSKSFICKPEILFDLNEKWSVGAAVGYSRTNPKLSSEVSSVENGTNIFEYQQTNQKIYSYDIQAFARYKYANAGKATFFVDGGLAYNRSTVKGITEIGRIGIPNFEEEIIYNPDGYPYNSTHFEVYESKVNAYGVFVCPGISYKLADFVSVEAHFGNLSYIYSCTKLSDRKGKLNNFDFDLKSSLMFGIYFRL